MSAFPDQLLTTLLEDGMDLTDVYLLGYFRRGLHGQGYSFQGDKYLSGLLHINPRQIQRHIRKLEEKGILSAAMTAMPWAIARSISPQNRISVWHPAVLLSFQQFRFSVCRKNRKLLGWCRRPMVEIQKFSTLKLLKRLKRTEMS